MSTAPTTPHTDGSLRRIRPLTQPQLIGLVAVFLLLSANLRFFREVIVAFPIGGRNAGFLLSLPLLIRTLARNIWTCR